MFSTERECQRQQPWERASSVIETQTHCRGVALALQVQFTAAYAGPGKKTPPTWGMCHTIFTQHGKESLPTEGNEGNEEGICWDQEEKLVSLAMYLWWAGSYVDRTQAGCYEVHRNGGFGTEWRSQLAFSWQVGCSQTPLHTLNLCMVSNQLCVYCLIYQDIA